MAQAPAPSPPPLSYLVRYDHPMRYQRVAMIKANSLADAQEFAAASIKNTLWIVHSVTPYTPTYG